MNRPEPRSELRKPLPANLLAALQARLGERVSTSSAVLEHHGKDESAHPLAPPDAVVFPETTEEVVEIVRLGGQYNVPLIPFGAGSSIEGHVLAIHGGLSVDFTRMNRIHAVNVDDLDATVEPGVTRKQLNNHLDGTGIFFPIDPGADATLGGMAATRASGTNAVRYGTMKENVLGLTVVLADGRVIRTGGRARKSSAGYDLTRLFVGSEGTLGVITEITLRLYPQPEAVSAAVCAFPSVDAAVRTVIQTIQLGVPIARCELLDALTIKAVNRYSRLNLREAPMLFCEFHGTAASVAEQAQTVQEIAKELGGLDFEWAIQQEDRTRLWQARHDAYPACRQLRPGNRAFSTDVCVPISRLAECIAESNADIAKASMPIALFGHVGDGNFHLVVLIDPGNPADIAEAEAINKRVVIRALKMGGTCTGEHGIGIGKLDFLDAEHGAAVPVMAAIKQALDPRNLLNPGKVIR
ncbi:MAG: 2-hydroxy-acid oxidase [Betaproteobacteria bacterium RIFCSPLOWO2_12_FULL_62_58]|nr:MAG: 2-hydroxy-acid oxidase [Betaproteobacteria bacterium RIFCSPLOWO2_12_FULL_62_58]